jgi:F0F1-type ATP synthase assembly protein I
MVDSKSDNKDNFTNLSKLKNQSFLSVGIDLCSHVMLGLGVGLFLDKYFTTKPIFLVLCLFVGIASAIKVILKIK